MDTLRYAIKGTRTPGWATVTVWLGNTCMGHFFTRDEAARWIERREHFYPVAKFDALNRPRQVAR